MRRPQNANGVVVGEFPVVCGRKAGVQETGVRRDVGLMYYLQTDILCCGALEKK